MKVLSNQYSITLGQELSVYYYHMNVIPELKIKDSSLLLTLVRKCKACLDMALGLYIFSGKLTFESHTVQARTYSPPPSWKRTSRSM